MVEDIIKKVTEAQAKADLNIELIGDLLGDQLRQDSNVVPRLEKLEKQQLLCKYKNELKELKGGENMSEQPKYDPRDINKDGKVTPTESNLYEFFQGVIGKTQKYSLWSNLGTMVFLVVYTILSALLQ